MLEGDIVHAQGLCLAQIVEAGVAAVAGRLSRRRAMARDVALEHGEEAIRIRRIASLETTSRIKPLRPVARLSLWP